jgi:hypothetical protein
MKNPHIGSTLNDFLSEEGVLAECQAEAIKKVVSWQLDAYIKEHRITKIAMAQKLDTSRGGLDRLLDANNTSVTLNSLTRAVEAMGKRLEISIV